MIESIRLFYWCCYTQLMDTSYSIEKTIKTQKKCISKFKEMALKVYMSI